MNKEDILNKLTKQAAKLHQSFSVNKIGLFGSFAADRANDKSDVDIIVELNDPSFDHYMDIKFYLEKLFGRSVDLVVRYGQAEASTNYRQGGNLCQGTIDCSWTIF